MNRLGQFPGVGQRRRLGVHAAVLDGALHRVDALREQSLYPFIEEKSRTIRVLVDHPCRQIVRQFPLGFDLDRQRAHDDTSHDDARRVDRRIGFAEGRDHAVAPPRGGPQVDEQDLVLGMVDDRRQCGPASRQVGGGQLALEDGELQVVAEPAHGLEDFAEALVVADVVADEVGGAHGYIVAFEGLKFRYFPSVKRAARYTCATPGLTRPPPIASSKIITMGIHILRDLVCFFKGFIIQLLFNKIKQ